MRARPLVNTGSNHRNTPGRSAATFRICAREYRICCQAIILSECNEPEPKLLTLLSSQLATFNNAATMFSAQSPDTVISHSNPVPDGPVGCSGLLSALGGRKQGYDRAATAIENESHLRRSGAVPVRFRRWGRRSVLVKGQCVLVFPVSPSPQATAFDPIPSVGTFVLET